jgi:hypothetical protein
MTGRPAARVYQSMRLIDVIALTILAAMTSVGVLAHEIGPRAPVTVQVTEAVAP